MCSRPFRSMFWVVSLALIGLIAVACDFSSTPPQILNATAVTYTPVTPFPTLTISPTNTQEPTDTSTPTPIPSPTLQPSNTPAPTKPTGQQTVVPTFTDKSAKDAMVNAFKNLNHAYPFRLTEDTTSSGGITASRTTDFAAADRTHTILTDDPIIPGLTEEIRIGSQLYYLYNGAWTTDAPPGVGAGSQDLAQLLINALTSVTYAGQDTVMNVPCFVFTFQSTLPLGSTTMNGTGKAWIGISDDLPHQVDSTHTVVGVSGSSSSHLVYSYGVNFDIQAPIK